MDNTIIGGCSKHKGQSMIDCPLCYMEEYGNKGRLSLSSPLSAESAVEGLRDIFFFGKGTENENYQKAIVFMEGFIKKIKK